MEMAVTIAPTIETVIASWTLVWFLLRTSVTLAPTKVAALPINKASVVAFIYLIVEKLNLSWEYIGMGRIMTRTLELVSQTQWAAFCYRYAGYDDALRMDEAFEMVLACGNGVILPRYLLLVAKAYDRTLWPHQTTCLMPLPVKMTVSALGGERSDIYHSFNTLVQSQLEFLDHDEPKMQFISGYVDDRDLHMTEDFCALWKIVAQPDSLIGAWERIGDACSFAIKNPKLTLWGRGYPSSTAASRT